MKLRNALLLLSNKIQGYSDTTRTFIQTGVIALVSALSSVAFLVSTNLLFNLTFVAFASHSVPFFIIASFITVLLTSLAVGLLLNFIAPEAAGSGIPQVKASYWKDLGYIPIRIPLVKFVAGVLSIGGGTSLGREGPTVQIGSGLSSWLSGFMGVSKRKRRGPLVVGAASSLAAAFNTPLGAITFVLEEIMGDMSSRSIGPVVMASVLGAFTVYALLGRQPAFSLPSIEQVTWVHYLIAPVAALLGAMMGVVFQRSVLLLRPRIKNQRKIPRWALPLVGGLITWVLGISVYATTGKIGVFGLGYQDLSAVLNNHFIWWIAGIMIVAKLAATIFSYSFGGAGGIFSPLLFIGGLAGYFVGGLAGLWVPLTESDRIVLSAVGMSACLGAVVRAPLSSLLIVFEMTHQFALIPGLLIGLLVSVLVSKTAGPLNFYDALLVQDGNQFHKIHPPLDIQGWQELPVGSVANPHPVILTNFDPKGVQEILAQYPYNYFPVYLDSKIQGVVQRDQLRQAITEGKTPPLISVPIASPDKTIQGISELFIKSPVGVILLATEKDGEEPELTGIITLHDLLRSQAAVLD